MTAQYSKPNFGQKEVSSMAFRILPSDWLTLLLYKLKCMKQVVQYLIENICCIASPLATKLLHIVLFHEDITQLKQKITAVGIHVI